jgi:hypothetical protein
VCRELKEIHGKINDLFPQKFTRREKESKKGNQKIKKLKIEHLLNSHISCNFIHSHLDIYILKEQHAERNFKEVHT